MKLTITSIILFIIFTGFTNDINKLKGDQNAVKLVERMLETIGGKETWKNARVIRTELRGYYAREQEPWYEIFWMDLESPNGRFVLDRPDSRQVITWTSESGWDFSNNKLAEMDSARFAFELEYWKRQPVVIFHRLAVNKPSTRVEMGSNEFRFDVFDNESGELLAQFAVNMKGEPIKWGSSIGEREFEHIFGPLEEFNNIRMPGWGATISGIWRYEHKSITLMKDTPNVLFDPPSAN